MSIGLRSRCSLSGFLSCRQPSSDRDDRILRQNVDVAGLDGCAVLGDEDRQVGKAAQNFMEEAFPLGIEMRHDDVRHTSVRFQPLEESLEGGNAPRRGPDTDDRKGFAVAQDGSSPAVPGPGVACRY